MDIIITIDGSICCLKRHELKEWRIAGIMIMMDGDDDYRDIASYIQTAICGFELINREIYNLCV